MALRPLLPVLLAVSLHAPALPQGATDPASAAIEAGRRALDEGRTADAYRHLLHALEHRPHSTEVIELLLATSDAAGDEDARLLWTHGWTAAAADDAGRVKPGDVRDLLGDDKNAARVAAARVAAVEELLRFAAGREKKGRKSPEELLVARWARRVARELASASPALFAAHAAELDPGLETGEEVYRPVIRALERLASSLLANGNAGDSLRAARVLHGLGVQAAFEDLKGPKPRDMDKVRAAGRAAMARARERLAAQQGEPWTVEELEWLTSEEGERYTREHASFAWPGVAVSPQGWYRIETDCGFETLLGVTQTIELHHQRLANWYGTDPFTDRPGVCRIVPEAHGLESEGAPFWWAGGFQGGDTTTMRFSCGTIEGLGHGLTHELTHRFDGALYPGQMSWLVEGKAVWTGAAYGLSSDEDFVTQHCLFGTVESAFIKGYGSLDNLTKLVEGTIDDYRDNYVAGYALYVYLTTWDEGGRLLFADRMLPYMEGGAKGNQDPKAWFERHFCDGKDGRPADLAGFAERFGEYISGFYWRDPKPWTKKYTSETGDPGGHPWVYDEPTWTWSRSRAEPTFGEGQALVAGSLLAELGKKQDAVRALVWGLSADGRTPRAERRLADLCRELKRNDAAWVLEQELAFPHRDHGEPAPFLGTLSKTRALVELLDEASLAYSESERRAAAAALAADRDRLASWLGVERVRPAAPAGDALVHPFDAVARPLGAEGWVEDDLTGYEERRVPDLWYAAENGDLHVGRKAPRTGTGKLDRNARQRDAFARSTAYQLPGTYRIRTRLQFTTSFASGAVVFGHTRRDRDLRLRFSGGDFMYAIGESEKEPVFDSVRWRVDGLRDRDGPLNGSLKGGRFEFGREVTAFDLELLVDGASVQVFLNESLVATYHTVDGAPIEGHVGFATSFGAIRAQAPSVQRLERSRLAGRPNLAVPGLDIARGVSVPFGGLENRPVHGIQPSTNGTLVLWIPLPWLGEGDELDVEELFFKASKAATKLAKAMENDDATQSAVIAVPTALGEERLAVLRDEVADSFPRPVTFVTHSIAGGDDAADLNKRWILFVDTAGVARVVSPFFSHAGGFEPRLAHWLTVFRDHGRPERELPEPKRLSEEEDGDAGDGDDA